MGTAGAAELSGDQEPAPQTVVPVGAQEWMLALKMLSIFAISSPKFLFPLEQALRTPGSRCS